MTNRIYNENCLDTMDRMKDDFIDLRGAETFDEEVIMLILKLGI